MTTLEVVDYRQVGELVLRCFRVSGQREEDEVRRRCASIMYSDPLFWDTPAETGKT